MTEYKKDYFEDRKLKYEKNHGVFIHAFMFTEFSNRILGQCNVALNDLQRQLDVEIARAKVEEKRLDSKIDAETTRATAEETRLDGKIDEEITKVAERENNYLPKAGGGMNPRSLISWDFDLGDTSFGTVGGLKWSGAEDYITITGEANNRDNMNLVIRMGTDNSNAIVFKNTQGNEVASIHTDGEYTGSIEWARIKNRPEIDKQALSNLNQIKNNINKVLKYTNLYYTNNYDINEIDDNNKIGYTSIMLTPNGYGTGTDSERPLNEVLNLSFATIATALNQINTRLNALENK